MTFSLTTKASGIYGGGSFGYGFADASGGQGLGPFYVAHVVLNQAQAIINPATDDTLQTIAATLKGTLNVSFASDPTALAQDATVAAITTKLGAPAQDATVAAITTRLGVSPAQDGADVTGATMPAGGAGIRGWLSASFGKLTAIANSLAGTVAVSAQTLPLPAGAATDATVAAVTAKLNAGVAVSLASAPLPPGAATDASLLAIKAALQAQLDLATSVWTDGTNFYVRREVVNEATGAITVSFTNPDGSASTAAATGLKPVASDNALTLIQTQFDVITAGTGTASGDVLARVIVVNKAVTPPATSGALWLNLTQGTTLASAPVAASIAEQTQHLAISSAPANLAQDASLQQIVTKLTSLGVTVSNFPATQATSTLDGQNATLGAKGDAAATSASTNGSLIAWLRGLFNSSVSQLNALTQLHTDVTSTPAVAPARGVPVDVSKTSVGNTSMVLIPANATRLTWAMQAPQAADVWINPTGGAAGAGLTGCFLVPAGTNAGSSKGAVETGAITCWCAISGLIIPAITF